MRHESGLVDSPIMNGLLTQASNSLRAVASFSLSTLVIGCSPRYYFVLLIHEAGLLVVIHAVEKAKCFGQWRSFKFAEAGLKHLDSCGAVVPMDSGEPLNPAFERYLPGFICVSAFLI